MRSPRNRRWAGNAADWPRTGAVLTPLVRIRQIRHQKKRHGASSHILVLVVGARKIGISGSESFPETQQKRPRKRSLQEESYAKKGEFLGGLACGAGEAACGASSSRESDLGRVRVAGKTNTLVITYMTSSLMPVSSSAHPGISSISIGPSSSELPPVTAIDRKQSVREDPSITSNHRLLACEAPALDAAAACT